MVLFGDEAYIGFHIFKLREMALVLVRAGEVHCGYYAACIPRYFSWRRIHITTACVSLQNRALVLRPKDSYYSGLAIRETMYNEWWEFWQ